jgi:hypothetical protein
MTGGTEEYPEGEKGQRTSPLVSRYSERDGEKSRHASSCTGLCRSEAADIVLGEWYAGAVERMQIKRTPDRDPVIAIRRF